MTSLQDKMYENRIKVFFLINIDYIFSEESLELIKALHNWPRNLNHALDQADERHRIDRISIEKRLILRKERFETNIFALEEQLKELTQYGELNQYKMIIDKVLDYHQLVVEYEEEMSVILQEEIMMFGFKSNFEGFARMKSFFMPFYDLWRNANDFLMKKSDWTKSALMTIDALEVDQMIKNNIKNLHRLSKHFDEKAFATRVLNQLAQQVKDLNEWLPVIEVLCNPSLKPRHWKEIQEIANEEFNYENITLNEVKYFNVKEHLGGLADISERASKEFSLEKILNKMESEWTDLKFVLGSWRDTGIPILKGDNVEEI